MSAILSDSQQEIDKVLARYPSRRSGMLPVLWMVQKKTGWVSQEAMAEVAEIIGCTTAEVYEVVSFYTMFQQKPTGRHHIALCDTLACAICGTFEIVEYLKEKHGIEKNKVTEDGRFSLELVECIGACNFAPAMLLGEDLYGELTPEKIDKLLDERK
ncbi:NADH-quinone oxidoreductase subunit NuoE [bacterium]|nr:NADH-quinone oxidoreductase subunit NuoE [bacterium]